MFVMSLVCVMGRTSLCQAEAMGGKRAPAFTLTDAEGQKRSLSEFQGKFVVLEWFNYDCPFTRKHYASGNMQQLQRMYTAKGVVWLSINSSAPGKQGTLTPETAKQRSTEQKIASTAVLLDSSGKVGRIYGAKTTPQLFIIDPEGTVIYTGAIDDKPSVDPADISTAKNYVQRALDEALAGKPVSVAETRSYGCSVKY